MINAYLGSRYGSAVSSIILGKKIAQHFLAEMGDLKF
jgi:hypothetical protein